MPEDIGNTGMDDTFDGGYSGFWSPFNPSSGTRRNAKAPKVPDRDQVTALTISGYFVNHDRKRALDVIKKQIAVIAAADVKYPFPLTVYTLR